jgi:hypothetical protein
MARSSKRDDGLADNAAQLLQRAAMLAGEGKVAEALALQQQAAALLEQASSLPEADAAGGPGAQVPMPPPDRSQATREVSINALNDLGVPSSPRAIGDYAYARFGVRLEPRLFASLRRDEQRAWRSTRSHRPVYIVPALTAAAPGRLLAMRGKLALSDWPLERRLVGPWTERVDHLTATVNLASQLAWLRTVKPAEADRVAALLARYAVTVPGALGGSTTPDPARIERAARAELDVLRRHDQEWRATTAATARKLVGPDQQLWGVPLPRVLESTG